MQVWRQVPLECESDYKPTCFGDCSLYEDTHHVVPSYFIIFCTEVCRQHSGISKDNNHWIHFHFFGLCMLMWQPSLLVSVCLLSSCSKYKMQYGSTQWDMLCTHKNYKNGNVVIYIALQCTWFIVASVSLHGTDLSLLHGGELHCMRYILTYLLCRVQWECQLQHKCVSLN
jgi:hypothetical protein